jgi:hypothetical protein
MKPSTQSSIYEISCQQSWRQEEEDSQEDGERLQYLQSLTSSSSRRIRPAIILPSIPLRSPQKVSFFQKNRGRPTTIDIINQALEIIEEDDDDDESTMMLFRPSKPHQQ